jgi:lysophospholipase L1-like esterase
MGWSSFGRGLLLILVPLVLFLALAEVALRFYLDHRILYDVEMARYAQLLKVEAENPRIGHVHRPNGKAKLMGVDVTINSLGFRDEEPRPGADDLRRIIFLGDSLTFGWGVEQDEIFAALLEESLDAEEPTEVLNFGTGNYNTTQEVELFLERGLDLHPDRVVVFYFINDAEPVPTRSPFSFFANLRIVTFYWSRLGQLRTRWNPARTFREYYAALYEDDQVGWRETRDAFARLATVCRERGIDLRVVLLPELHELANYPFAREYDRVEASLKSLGVPVLDLTPAFADVIEPETLWVSLDDAHPNAAAHERIARASHAFISDRAAGR